MRSKKLWMILASGLLIIGIVGMIFTYSSAYEKTTVKQEETFDESFEEMDVQMSNTKTEVISTDKDTSKITLEGKKYKNDSTEDFSIDVEDNKLIVKQKDTRHHLINFDFFQPSLSLKIHLPKKQYEALYVSGSNGRIDMKQIQADHIKLQSGNGVVNLSQVSGETIDASTSNGKLKFKDVDGKIKGNTNNGLISLETTDLDRDIELKSSNGLIDIKTENEPTNTTFVADTGNGTANILDKYNGGTVIGDGDHTIELTTGNGKITVTKAK